MSGHLRGGPAAILFAAACALGGCAATIPPGAGGNPADPFERVNRHIDAFNTRFDENVGQPAARGYNAVLPRVLRDCLSNIFDNLAEVGNLFNATLQAKAGEAARDAGRLLINSTVGIGGCFDVATPAGLERKRQNFGVTMGTWGVPQGAYLVLPLLGPSTVRQTAGLIPDFYLTDPVGYLRPAKDVYYVGTVRLLGDRAAILDASRLVDEAALDRYTFLRDGYLQRLRSRVNDGSGMSAPPIEDPDAPDPPGDAPPPAAPPAVAPPGATAAAAPADAPADAPPAR